MKNKTRKLLYEIRGWMWHEFPWCQGKVWENFDTHPCWTFTGHLWLEGIDWVYKGRDQDFESDQEDKGSKGRAGASGPLRLFMGKANPAVGRGTPIPPGRSWMVRTVRPPPSQVSFCSIPSTPVLHSPTHSSSSFFVQEHPLHPWSPSAITCTHLHSSQEVAEQFFDSEGEQLQMHDSEVHSQFPKDSELRSQFFDSEVDLQI
jgi:hypothetical protein